MLNYSKAFVLFLIFAVSQGNVITSSESTSFSYWRKTFDFFSTQGEPNSPYCFEKVDGFYAYEKLCIPDFYGCVEGTKYNLTCQEGNHVFDITSHNCVDISVASCRDLTSTPYFSTRPPLHCFPGETGVFPIGPCSQSYYECTNGIMSPARCPSEFVFDEYKRECTSPSNVPGCSTTISITSTTIASTTTAEVILTSPSVIAGCPTNVPSPFKCPPEPLVSSYCQGPCRSSYWFCILSTAFNTTCAAGSVFTGANCVALSSVPECAPPTTTTALSVTTKTTTVLPTIITTPRVTQTTPRICTPPSVNNSFHCPSPEGNFAIPGAPCEYSDYYICVSCAPYIKTCPQNSFFDAIKRVCVSKDNLSCNICRESDGNFPINPNLCQNEFYMCISGVPHIEKCPGLSVFDPNEKKCKASCPSALMEYNLVMPQSSWEQRCTGKSDGFYPIMDNHCQPDYIVCVSGNLYVEPSQQVCPDSSVFDPVAAMCKPLEFSSCPYLIE